MKKEMKGLLRLWCVAFLLMLVVPLAYRVFVHFWPPEDKTREMFEQYSKEVQRESCIKLLIKPIARWSDDEVKLEPEIYAWLMKQSNEILPWDWTEEARRKDQKGYVKCWRRVWKERKSCCEKLLAENQKETKRIDRELQILTTIHEHRTNQIVRLRTLATTNTFPCQISVERLEKGRLWGWNKMVEVKECKGALEIIAATNSICSAEIATSVEESRNAKALSDSLTSSKQKLTLCEKLCEICDKSNSLIENEISTGQDELLQNSLVEVLKGAK